MPLNKTAVGALDAGSEVIGKAYLRSDGFAIRIAEYVKESRLLGWITADFLTTSRFIVAIVNPTFFTVGILVRMNLDWLFAVSFTLIIYAYASDYWDGPFARAEIRKGEKENSDLGSKIDNAADKAICIPSMIIVMYLMKVYWVPGIVIGIDLSLTFFRLYLGSRYALVIEANHYGKFKTWFQGSGISFVLFNHWLPGVNKIGYVFLILAIVLGCFSFLKHYRNIYPQIQEAKRA